MAKKNEREEQVTQMLEKTALEVEYTSLKSPVTLKKYQIQKGIDTQMTCANELQTAFGLIGKFSKFSTLNHRPIYCPANQYTCCSDSQIESSMTQFGKAMVNLRKNLDPMIEISVIMMTKEFTNFFMRNLKYPICGNIIERAFNKDPRLPTFVPKKFLNYFFV